MNIGDVVYCEGYGGKDGMTVILLIGQPDGMFADCRWWDGRRFLQGRFRWEELSLIKPGGREPDVTLQTTTWQAVVSVQGLRYSSVGPGYSSFTDRARKVMQLANQEAQRCNRPMIGTEDVLLGLVKEGSGVAAIVLRNMGVDLRKIRVEVERLVLPEPQGAALPGKLPQTERTKLAVAAAIDAARELGHNYVGTEHLLLGLLAGEGIAVQVLANVGVDREKVRQGVLTLLGQAAELAKSNRLLAAMSQATPTSDARQAVAAEQAAEQPSPCPIGHDKLMDPCQRMWCGCGCVACAKMCGEKP